MKKITNELLKSFLGKDELRPAMSHPFKDNGNIVATNAHIMLIAPESYFDSIPDYPAGLKFPNYKAVIPATSENSVLSIPISDFDKSYSTIPLHDVFKPCELCMGYGTQECNLGHDHDCEYCGGSGDSREFLHKDVSEYAVIVINDIHIKAKFLKLIVDVIKQFQGQAIGFYCVSHKSANIIKINDATMLVMPIIWGENDGMYQTYPIQINQIP